MRIFPTLLAAAAITVVSMPTATSARTTAQRCQIATKPQVEALFADFYAAWATGNPATVAALFSRDAVLLPTVSNTPRTDAAGITDYFTAFLRSRPVGQINTSAVSIDCNTAARVGTWTVTLTNPTTGAVTNVAARYSFIYKYEAGSWKIYHLHSSANPEVAH